MSMIWVAILASVLGREGRPSSLATAPPRPVVGRASTTRLPGSTPRLVLKRHASHRHIGPFSNTPDDDAFDDDIFDEEDVEESWTIDLDLPVLDPEAWHFWSRPPSDGDLGRLPSPDLTPRAPLHLRC
jgi:hypothetical protein